MDELEVDFLLEKLTDVYFERIEGKLAESIDTITTLVVNKYISLGLNLDDCDLSQSKEVISSWEKFEKLTPEDIHTNSDMQEYMSSLYYQGEDIRRILATVIPDMCINLERLLDETKNIDADKLQKYTEFMLQLPVYVDIMHNYRDIGSTMADKSYELKFEEAKAYNDGKLYAGIKKVCDYNPDKCSLLFHGTQCRQDAYSITEQGFGMYREDLSSTTYENMTAKQALMYSRGLDGSIGAEAMVVIYQPPGENIVEDMGDRHIENPGSGLQGFGNELEYVVPNRYIMCIIDKVCGEVVYNPHFEYKEEFNLTDEDFSKYNENLAEIQEEIENQSDDFDDIFNF